MNASDLKFIAYIIGIGLVVAAAAALIYISAFILAGLLSFGALFGGGVSLFNYMASLKNNISLERPSS